ncbi:MAG: hypothetical protein R3330_12975, partial [Saprospiraceae bacterium]|nr:hypothetical protein [Saprospiraceae bacterium]
MNTDLTDWNANLSSTSWFFGVGIDVHDGREINVEAEGGQLAAQHLTQVGGQARVGDLPESSHRGQVGYQPTQPGHRPALLVDRHWNRGPVRGSRGLGTGGQLSD